MVRLLKRIMKWVNPEPVFKDRLPVRTNSYGTQYVLPRDIVRLNLLEHIKAEINSGTDKVKIRVYQALLKEAEISWKIRV